MKALHILGPPHTNTETTDQKSMKRLIPGSNLPATGTIPYLYPLWIQDSQHTRHNKHIIPITGTICNVPVTGTNSQQYLSNSQTTSNVQGSHVIATLQGPATGAN